jgi:hypothetical protein
MTFRRPAPFRLQAPDPLDLDIHEVCASALDRLLAPPAIWACYPAGAVELTAAQHARYARMGLKRGIPDIDHDAVARGDVLLCLSHRLVSGSPRPEAEAVAWCIPLRGRIAA